MGKSLDKHNEYGLVKLLYIEGHQTSKKSYLLSLWFYNAYNSMIIKACYLLAKLSCTTNVCGVFMTHFIVKYAWLWYFLYIKSMVKTPDWPANQSSIIHKLQLSPNNTQGWVIWKVGCVIYCSLQKCIVKKSDLSMKNKSRPYSSVGSVRD